MSYHLGALLVGAGKPADAVAPLAAGVKLNAGLAVELYAGNLGGGQGRADGGQRSVRTSAGRAALGCLTTLDARNAARLLGNLTSTAAVAAAIEQYRPLADPRT